MYQVGLMDHSLILQHTKMNRPCLLKEHRVNQVTGLRLHDKLGSF